MTTSHIYIYTGAQYLSLGNHKKIKIKPHSSWKEHIPDTNTNRATKSSNSNKLAPFVIYKSLVWTRVKTKYRRTHYNNFFQVQILESYKSLWFPRRQMAWKMKNKLVLWLIGVRDWRSDLVLQLTLVTSKSPAWLTVQLSVFKSCLQ